MRVPTFDWHFHTTWYHQNMLTSQIKARHSWEEALSSLSSLDISHLDSTVHWKWGEKKGRLSIRLNLTTTEKSLQQSAMLKISFVTSQKLLKSEVLYQNFPAGLIQSFTTGFHGNSVICTRCKKSWQRQLPHSDSKSAAEGSNYTRPAFSALFTPGIKMCTWMHVEHQIWLSCSTWK